MTYTAPVLLASDGIHLSVEEKRVFGFMGLMDRASPSFDGGKR